MSLACLIIPGAKVIEYKLNEEKNNFERSEYYTSKQIVCSDKRSIVYNNLLLTAFNGFMKKNYNAAEYLNNLKLPLSLNIDEIINKTLIFFRGSFYVVATECLIGLSV